MIYKSEINPQGLWSQFEKRGPRPELNSDMGPNEVIKFVPIRIKGDLAQMVERVLSMHEAQGSIPWFSTFWFSDFMLFKSLYLLNNLNKAYEYVKIAKIHKLFSLFA